MVAGLSPTPVEDMDSDVNIVTNNYIGRLKKKTCLKYKYDANLLNK